MPIEMIDTEEFHAGTQIKVMGVGGGGAHPAQGAGGGRQPDR